MGLDAAGDEILYSKHTLSPPLPPSSPRREMLLTTAAALHPVSIHTLPGRPISGLTAYNCVYVSVCLCEGVISLSLGGSRHLPP